MMGVLAGLLLVISAASLGRLALRSAALRMDMEEELAVSFGLGLMLLSYGTLLLGLTGMLNPAALWAFAGLVILAGLPGAWRPLVQSLFALRRLTEVRWILLPLVVSIFCLASGFLAVLVPDTANDSLAYHLHIPKLFLIRGSLYAAPYEINALFPFFMEMLYTLGLGLGQLSLAQFFHFTAGVSAGLAVAAFGMRWMSRPYAWAAGLLFVTTPGILNQLPTTYVDPGLSAFTILALFCLLRHRESSERGWLTLSGVFAGAAMSIKFLALISLIAMGLLLIENALRKKRNVLRDLVIWMLPILALSAYWYVRSWIELGNPVFPYFAPIFGTGDFAMHYDDVGIGHRLPDLLRIPWEVTMNPQKFEGFGVQIGPGYLAFIPMLFLLPKRPSWLNPVLFFLGFYLVCWFFLGQSLRFLFPVLPAAALLAGQGLAAFDTGKRAHAVVVLLLSAVLTGHAALAGYHFLPYVPAAIGLENPQDYLRRTERTYEMAEFVNAKLPPQARILNVDDPRMFYFRREMIRESIYARTTGYAAGLLSETALRDHLRQAGFTHVLWVRGDVPEPVAAMEPMRLPRLLGETQNALADWLEPLYTTSFTAPERRFHYTLYRITQS